MITNIDEIKQAVDIVDLVGSYVKLKKAGNNMLGLCPFHNEKSPSFNVSKQGFKCFGCGKSGDAVAFVMEHDNKNYVEAIKFLADKYGIEVEDDNPKEYIKPVPRLEKLPQKMIAWFEEQRKISNNTLLRFGITSTNMSISKDTPPQNLICFNYFRDEELINIKYRSADKKFMLERNAELIFYNLDAIKDETECVIVEGEIDCLSAYEAGIYNAVSVPNGAGVGNTQLKYLDNCWKWFENKTRIIILTDDDEPGRKLRDELSRRLGRDRCYKSVYPEGCKDLNAILQTHGPLMVQSVVEQASLWPIEGIVDSEEWFEKASQFYKDGYPEGFRAGIGDFDELLTFSGGQFTVVTGAPGSGKSEFIDHLTTRLAMNHGWPCAVASFENPVEYHVTKLMEKYTGLAFGFRKNPYQRMTQEQFNEAAYFIDQKYTFINVSQADISISGLLLKLRELVLRKGVKMAVIDPWNYLEHKQPANQTETQYISEALSLIKEFCVRHDVHLFLVAHPRKLMKDPQTKKYPIATMYDIAGSAHFFNKTDNGISIHRDHETGQVDVYVQKVRFSWLGKTGYTSFTFDTFTRQYKPI